jgi:hypothetical protein
MICYLLALIKPATRNVQHAHVAYHLVLMSARSVNSFSDNP